LAKRLFTKRPPGNYCSLREQHRCRVARHFTQESLSHCDMICERKIDGRQGIDFWGISVYHLLTDLPSIHYSFFSGLAGILQIT
jgi:hypothetical protein